MPSIARPMYRKEAAGQGAWTLLSTLDLSFSTLMITWFYSGKWDNIYNRECVLMSGGDRVSSLALVEIFLVVSGCTWSGSSGTLLRGRPLKLSGKKLHNRGPRYFFLSVGALCICADSLALDDSLLRGSVTISTAGRTRDPGPPSATSH